MTETEWQSSLLLPPLLHHGETWASLRQHLLLAVAFCRRIVDPFPDQLCMKLVRLVETAADHPWLKPNDPAVIAKADSLVLQLEDGWHRDPGRRTQRGEFAAAVACARTLNDPYGAIESVADAVTFSVTEFDRPWMYWQQREQESHALADLLRDIFGNPFRPVAFDPAWRTETVVALASAIYAERAFDRMPILADALEEAGCDHADILAHCRGPGPHARGCWVVDAVLGMQ